VSALRDGDESATHVHVSSLRELLSQPPPTSSTAGDEKSRANETARDATKWKR